MSGRSRAEIATCTWARCGPGVRDRGARRRPFGGCVGAPRTYDEVVIDGRSGLVMDRLEGADLLTIIGRKPWRVFESGRLTGEVHARINAARAPARRRRCPRYGTWCFVDSHV
jgi:hypothetical protein